jgi:hypothetical protein
VIQSHRLQSLEAIFTCHISTVHKKRVRLDPLPIALTRKATLILHSLLSLPIPSPEGRREEEREQGMGKKKRTEGRDYINFPTEFHGF